MIQIIKYPRTKHLDDSCLQDGDEGMNGYKIKDLPDDVIYIYEEKIDGANSGFRFDGEGILYAQSRGHFINVLVYATTLNYFYSWGSGGYIVKKENENIIDIPNNYATEYFSKNNIEKENLEKEREDLLQKLKENESKLNNLNHF